MLVVAVAAVAVVDTVITVFITTVIQIWSPSGYRFLIEIWFPTSAPSLQTLVRLFIDPIDSSCDATVWVSFDLRCNDYDNDAYTNSGDNGNEKNHGEGGDHR